MAGPGRKLPPVAGRLTVADLGLLGYVVKLDDAGVRATKDHLIRYWAQVVERIGEGSLDAAINRLIYNGCVTRHGREYLVLGAHGRNTYAHALEILGVPLR